MQNAAPTTRPHTNRHDREKHPTGPSHKVRFPPLPTSVQRGPIVDSPHSLTLYVPRAYIGKGDTTGRTQPVARYARQRLVGLLVSGTEQPGTEAAGCRFASHVDERCGEEINAQTRIGGANREQRSVGGEPNEKEREYKPVRGRAALP